MQERKHSFSSISNRYCALTMQKKDSKLSHKEKSWKKDKQPSFQILEIDQIMSKQIIDDRKKSFDYREKKRYNYKLSKHSNSFKQIQQLNLQQIYDLSTLQDIDQSDIEVSEQQRYHNSNDYLSFAEKSDIDYFELELVYNHKKSSQPYQRISYDNSQLDSDIESQSSILQYNCENQYPNQLQNYQILTSQPLQSNLTQPNNNNYQDIQKKFYNHTFANQPSPFEDLQQTFMILLQTLYICIMLPSIERILKYLINFLNFLFNFIILPYKLIKKFSSDFSNSNQYNPTK